ncbi:hypothetical protein K504DRAFT_370190 [Pleomassaria siparia CBS 279.74]|uniref:ZZ-type domain-containing protein n=1 Tax=Pleomassaria siparia CBS 279.74 TaxID=1314801 RepID=A0A6G1KJ07_9PLEO|nr:hypothetical protein K504DRAFT_370190 [Pleomassaria siparia CBS 279.74]
MATNVPVTLDTLIVIKIQFQGHSRKFKIPLRDLGAQVLPDKVSLLQLTSEDEVIFERYSDSAGAYVTLDSDKPQVYKTLFRAAKAKLKLRLRATIPGREIEPLPPAPVQETISHPQASPLHTMSAETLAPQVDVQTTPVIAHSPIPPPPLSTYRKPEVDMVEESPVSPLVANKADAEGEAPVPHSFTARQSFFSNLANASQNADLAFRPKESSCQSSWVVFCNNCNQPMEDAHYHCSICDHGDYDLCPSCVETGIHCPGAGHWMVKRFVKNGAVVNSTTERVGPKPKPKVEQSVPGAFTKPAFVEDEPTRTCNCCVKVMSEKEFVTCTSCDDYDLCMHCHITNKHGHHPGHGFKAATMDTTLPPLADFLCNAGRNVRHSAVCDGCEKFIYGVRHKCLNCPDWDFCSECIQNAKFIHPRHRFVPIYEPLAEPVSSAVRHYGIYCDGPLCKDKENSSYIEGIRYKCAVCHDTDFCANCEAIPSNRHNRTHPMIKFKTPVRSISVTTTGEDRNGIPIPKLGDQPARKSTATETVPAVPSENAATGVQTIVDMKPTEKPQPKTTVEKIEIRNLLAEPIEEKIPVKDLLSSVEGAKPSTLESTLVTAFKPFVARTETSDNLDAHFIRDTIPDGSKISSDHQFVQVWTLRNPGPIAWPAGCSVRHVGGDNMLNIDNSQPLSQSELADASESNVVGRSVEPGEEISFRIVMKAPKREGTAISYWRLKKADGTPFGHRLWCDINVVSPPTTTSPTTPVKSQAQHARSSQIEQATLGVSDHTARIQEEALERLRNLKLENSRIQKVRKAVVERVLENLRNEQEKAMVMQQDAVETAQSPAEKKPVERVEPQSSGMIFPKLDKESPASSTHEAVGLPTESQEVKSEIPVAAPVSENSDEEFFEDAESVELRSLSSDDEGFMTDEEYDILDASDEEMP